MASAASTAAASRERTSDRSVASNAPATRIVTPSGKLPCAFAHTASRRTADAVRAVLQPRRKVTPTIATGKISEACDGRGANSASRVPAITSRRTRGALAGWRERVARGRHRGRQDERGEHQREQWKERRSQGADAERIDEAEAELVHHPRVVGRGERVEVRRTARPIERARRALRPRSTTRPRRRRVALRIAPQTTRRRWPAMPSRSRAAPAQRALRRRSPAASLRRSLFLFGRLEGAELRGARPHRGDLRVELPQSLVCVASRARSIGTSAPPADWDRTMLAWVASSAS